MTKDKLGSLAEAFATDQAAKSDYRDRYPASKMIRNYILSTDQVRESVRCALSNECQWFKATAEEKEQDLLTKFIVCITCDNLYHIACARLDTTAVKEVNLPWMCHNCKTNPLNADAQELYNAGRHNIEFEKRVAHFLKQQLHDSDDDSDPELDKTLYIDAQGQLIPEAMQKRMKKLEEKLAKSEKKNQELEKSLMEKSQNLDSRATTSQSKSVSFADATFSTNAASTRIDEQAELSSLLNISYQPTNNEESSAISTASVTEIGDATILHLNELRRTEKSRNLPKIEPFDGRPEKWLTFQRAIERNKREGNLSDDMVKLQIRQGLKGQALARVDDLIDTMSAEQVMHFLRESFGNTSIVVDLARKKILNAKLSRPLTHASCVEITTYIANYIAACTYAKIPIVDSSLSSHIHQQLEPYQQQNYYEFYFRKHPDATTRLESLDVQFEFLNNISRTLPLGTFKHEENKSNNSSKPKGNYHVMSINNNGNSFTDKQTGNYGRSDSDKDAYQFEIRDKDTARFVGYDLVKVKDIPKKCEVCSRNNHYTVECRDYRKMKIDARYNLANTKGLCINCMISTTHSSNDCEIKQGCGFIIDKNVRCTAKHHITLHRGRGSFNKQSNSSGLYRKQQRRARTNRNADRAQEKIEKSVAGTDSRKSTQVLQQQSASAGSSSQSNVPAGYPVSPSTLSTVTVSKGPYQMCTVSSQVFLVNQSSHRTVKMFRTFFYGNNRKAIGYTVGDSGAEITLVKRSLVNDLGISGELTTINLQWTDSVIKPTTALKVKLRISGVGIHNEIVEMDECYAVDDLNLAPRSLNVEELRQKFGYLKNIPFDSYYDAVPSVLIGSRHAYIVEATEPAIHGGDSKPVALRTLLGYTIYGGAPECFESSFMVNNVQEDIPVEQGISNEELSTLYLDSCSIDNLGIKPKEVHLTKDEKNALELVEQEMKVLPNGSVELPLIWNRKDGKLPSLPDNFKMVYERQLAQERKLSKDAGSLEAFNKNFEELIKEGYVRPATERDMKSQWPNIWYLPMSLVINKNKQPYKTRNVYDASARYKGTSLNENLLMGPNLLVDILQPLMRMRMYKYAFTGDVKSMFHRVMICERDQQCQRILWRKNQNEPMQVYIQQVMLFGPASSPFGSQIVKNKTAEKWSNKYPEAAEALQKYTYMDDLLSSEPTKEKAIETATKCIEIMRSINWHLVGFQSNSLEVLQALNSDNVKQETIALMTTDEEAYTTKVLGVIWNPKLDAFTFQLNKNAFIKLAKECGQRPTKRDQCSTIARIFDAMGFIAHCLIRGKILLQRSWREKIDWDDEISDSAHKDWLKWLTDLEQVALLRIPRLRFHTFNFNEAESLELHTFCDAGKEAIAAVSYFIATINGYRYSSFIMAKAKVAPIKAKTKTEISEMPRLEMLAALIAARLTHTIQKLHKGHQIETYLWGDSEIVLNWLKNENIKLPRFAISPVEEVLELTDASQWNYVNSKENVADVATKFQKFNFGDINSEWFQGPKFLKLPKQHWPEQKMPKIQTMLLGTINQEAELVKSNIILPSNDCHLASDYFIDMLSAGISSSWSKLVRAVGRALKLYYEAIIPLLKSKQWNNIEARNVIKRNVDFHTLTPLEIERAELFIIRRMQKEGYPKEYERLKQDKRISTIGLLQLDVFMDHNGLIRISSRVDLPKNVYAQKQAPLVPRKSTFSRALLFDYHYRFNHVGIESQIAEFRSKYWMPQLRSALQRIQHLCNYCEYQRAHPVEYKMAPLPRARVDSSLQPFEVTGLDCAGPFTVYAKNGHQKKVWVLIFTCTWSRFIHLHLLDNLSSLAVFEAIMILWAAHGPVHQFISDNGTNFVGTANIIQSDARKIVDFLKEANRELESSLAQRYYTSWTFIPVQSPWFGAFYERLIQTVKKSIASSIEDRRITRVEFNIALQEAAHRINCRPLTYSPIATEDEEVLTPHIMAKKRDGWPLLPSIHGMKEIPDPLGDKNEYRRGRLLAEEVTRKFITQYLPVLTKRTKWFKDFSPIKVGDLVLLIDPNKTKRAWERARVHKLYMSRDNNARVADLLLPDGTVRKNRSVKRLAKLDIKSI